MAAGVRGWDLNLSLNTPLQSDSQMATCHFHLKLLLMEIENSYPVSTTMCRHFTSFWFGGMSVTESQASTCWMCWVQKLSEILHLYPSKITTESPRGERVAPQVFSCCQAAPWMIQSLRLSCPSFCPSHLFHYVPIIISSWNYLELLLLTEVISMWKVKFKAQRSRSQR